MVYRVVPVAIICSATMPLPPAHFLQWEQLIRASPPMDETPSHLHITAKKRPRTLLNQYTEVETISSVIQGHRLMDKMRELLATFKRSPQQMEMHEIMLRCIAKQVYGDAVWEHELEILEYNHWTNLGQEIVVTAPRRFGKSWGVAMFACVVLLVLKGCEISIFSSGARAAGGDTGMMSIVRKFLVEHFNMTKLWKDNSEHIFLKFAENDVRKLNAYPGSVHTYVSIILSTELTM